MTAEAVAHLLAEETGRAFPGAVLLVRQGGQDRLLAATGWTAEEAIGAVRRPVTADTVFDLASLTKPLCTMPVALSLVAAGHLDLGAPIGEVLPWVRGTWLAGLTMDLLLRHRSGLVAWRPFAADFLEASGLAAAGTPAARQFLRDRLVREAPEAAPGTACLYSDLGYLLAQEVCEATGGAPLDVLFARHVAAPLRLEHTDFRPIRPDPSTPEPPTEVPAATEVCPLRGRCLQGEVHDENAWMLGGVAGHAGLFSTAREVARIAETLRDSWTGTQPWLPASLVRSAWDPRHALPGTTRVLGLDTPSPEGSMAGDLAPPGTVGHLGFTGTSFWMHLPTGALVVLLTNRVHPSRAREGIREARRRLHDACWTLLHDAGVPLPDPSRRT